jgi:hypothetical protein
MFLSSIASQSVAATPSAIPASTIIQCGDRMASGMDYPKHAQPGDCFEKVHVEATFETFTRRLEVSPAHRDARVVPAAYAWADRPVLVASARTERRRVPATYRTVTETVVVTPGYVRVSQVPTIYGLDFEQVVVRPAHQEWRRVNVDRDGDLPDGARRDADGEIYCLVTVPAEYATLEHRVVRQPGGVTQTRVPAVTREVTREVVDQPARVEVTEIPAVYKIERFRRLISPRRVKVDLVPAVYADQEARREVEPAHYEWRKVACPIPGAGPAVAPSPKS